MSNKVGEIGSLCHYTLPRYRYMDNVTPQARGRQVGSPQASPWKRTGGTGRGRPTPLRAAKLIVAFSAITNIWAVGHSTSY